MLRIPSFFFVLVLLTGISGSLQAQSLDPDKEYQAVCIGFYNVENLFDTLDTEDVRDTEFTPQGSKKWNTAKYQHKLENLSRVISEMGVDVTPDGVALLGVSEVENKDVLEDLVKTEKLKDRNYQIVHYNSPDARGIDVALLYNPNYFEVTGSRSFKVSFDDDPDYKTRDQLLVSGILGGEKVHVMVAHWPSRRGGQKRSEPRRVTAAEVGRAVIDSLMAEDPEAKIFYMGDLNDDPVNRSVKKVMLTAAKPRQSGAKVLFNPMESYYKKGIGSLAWSDNWNLFDQIIMNPIVTRGEFREWTYYTARVFNKAYLCQAEGQFKGYPFRSFVGSNWMGGFSDHFPVYIMLVRELEK